MQKHTTDNKIYGVYLKSLLNQKVTLSITEIGNNLKQNLEKKIAAKIEGKCIVQGFIKPNSTRIVNYSSGNVNAAFVDFQVVFECMVCHPVEGMLIECKSKTITFLLILLRTNVLCMKLSTRAESTFSSLLASITGAARIGLLTKALTTTVYC